MEPSSSSSSKRKRDPDCFDELSCKRQKNDVFLNYPYEDIGKGFVSHLKGRLIGNGYNISDHTMLPIGGDESSELVKAIEESDIYLVVFSSKYASSIKCLDELVDIMDCHKKFKKRKVIPIFFKVNPSHARNQKGRSFTRAFKKHETTINPERVQKWRQALHKAGQLTGLPLQKGDEEKFLRKIVKMLRNMQNPQELCHLEFPVGIASRAQDLISVVSDQVFPIVAVLGISGSGKTTIAKAVYDRIAKDFEIKCYIGDIQNYQCRGGNWKFDLQKDAISCLTGNDKFPIGTHNDGAAKIKKIIKGRKALFVLDDVGEFEQLQALGIHPASLRCGSRIIVTTRNKESLSNLPYIPYELSLLNERESYELFARLAFGKDEPIDGKFVYEIVRRAEGVPLVLEVWGRYFKSHARTQWPSLLEKLKKIPHEDIQKKLKMSYDSLTEKRVKKFFLDIACFFVGKEKDLVIQVLQDEDSAFYPDIEIQYLVDRGLVKTDYNINMNHVIREMGQEVVHRENEDEPGQRTRLVDHRDVVRVLRDCSADWKKCFSPTMLNKTKETSHGFDSPELCSLSSVIVMFCPLNDTTLVVEAGDTVLLEFKIKDYSSIDFMSCGLRLIYEGEVVDSELISQNIFEPPPVTLITVPTSKMTPAADDEAAASITELDDDDNSVCSSPFQYNEIIYYKILDETFMNECFETSFPSEMMIVDDCSWNSSVI